MRGTILGTDGTSGMISANDKRFKFDIEEWKGSISVKEGMEVDFEAEGDVATGIYPIKVAGGSSKKIGAGLFAILLGGFGIHKFYLGYNTEGWIMLIVFLVGLIALGIPSLVIGIIAFIEGIIYLTKSDADFQETYIDNKRGWF